MFRYPLPYLDSLGKLKEALLANKLVKNTMYIRGCH